MPFIQYLQNDEYKYFTLPEDKKVVFGREDDTDFQIKNDTLISRKHFAIEKDENGEFILIDLKARNGTFFNGRRLSGDRIQLTDRDEIKAGKRTFRYFYNIPKDDPSKSVIEASPASSSQVFESQEEAAKMLNLVHASFHSEIEKVIIGQKEVINHILISLIARGHCLLIGVPGLAKTLIVRVLAGILDLGTNRIQFTPDLMPADITGTDILEEDENGNRRFRFNYGPIFTNILLADEINRTPPKTQAALLEAMQEQRVTASGATYDLPQPFLVLATQNPIEQEGTYPLPEAQVDRFMLKVIVDYPTRPEERLIMDRMTGEPLPPVNPVIEPQDLLRARDIVRQIYVDEKIKEYVLDLIFATRYPAQNGLTSLAALIAYGASPRATIYMIMAARAHAFLQGRGFVTPEDIKQIAPDVLRHRIVVSYEAEAEEISSADIVQSILDHIEVP